MKSREDQIWKILPAETESVKTKPISKHNFLGYLRPDFHCPMFYLPSLSLSRPSLLYRLLHTENGQCICTIGPAINYFFKSRKTVKWLQLVGHLVYTIASYDPILGGFGSF